MTQPRFLFLKTPDRSQANKFQGWDGGERRFIEGRVFIGKYIGTFFSDLCHWPVLQVHTSSSTIIYHRGAQSMIKYSQSTGIITLPDGTMFQGHAGHGQGLNNPAEQSTHAIGPLPQGQYSLGPWQDGSEYSAADARLGPFVSRLTPDPDNTMFGRDGFFFHGGNNSNPPTDSDGCIVLPRVARTAIAATQDTVLEVVE